MRNTPPDEYSTLSVAVATSACRCSARQGGGTVVQVEGVNLLGVGVTAYAVLDVAEHDRRVRSGIEAITDPALLDRLMDLPPSVSVADTIAWVETTAQPPGVVEREEDGITVTRLLKPPLMVTDVVLPAAGGRELAAVQEASLFAGFTRRWIAATRGCVPDAALLEAKLCGVGVLDRCGRVLVAGQCPAALAMDGWSWLLQEKTYRRWLSRRSRDHGLGNPSPATAEASAPREQ